VFVSGVYVKPPAELTYGKTSFVVPSTNTG
jgi:hypothetical protein